MAAGLALLTVMIVLYAALAVKLGRWSITMPMIFVATGWLLGPGVTGILPLSPHAEGVKELAEISLALLLFADASTLDFTRVRLDAGLPLRLITVGILLAMVLGAAVAWVLLPGQGLAVAALLGAILAPTDAALGLPIFTNPAMPVRIRRALNVESGLNDGIATPFVTLFIAFATITQPEAGGVWLTSALTEMGLGVLAGTALGTAGGWLLKETTRRGWTARDSKGLAILGLSLAAYFGSLTIGGNGFISAFVGGIVFGAVTQNGFAEPAELTETLGTFLSLLVWVVFGAVLLTYALHFTAGWLPIAYAVLSLTLVRMVAVAIALAGTPLRTDTILLMGWFGPRGLASVVFTLLALLRFEASGMAIDTLVVAATWTIFLSVLAHGLSARPLVAWYARRLESAEGQPPELRELPEPRSRRRILAAKAEHGRLPPG